MAEPRRPVLTREAELARAATIASYGETDRLGAYPLIDRDLADENRHQPWGAPLHGRLSSEVARAADRAGATLPIAADVLTRWLLTSPDPTLGGPAVELQHAPASAITVGRVLGHVVTLGVDLDDEVAVSIARRATIAILNHRWRPAMLPEAERYQPPDAGVPTATSAAPEPAGTHRQISRRVQRERPGYLFTCNDIVLGTGAARLCVECGEPAPPAVRRRVSGELLSSATETDEAFATAVGAFIAEAEEAIRSARADICIECGATLPVPLPAPKIQAVEEPEPEPKKRAERPIVGYVEATACWPFTDGMVEPGTVVAEVRSTPKERTGRGTDPRPMIAVQIRGKVRFVRIEETLPSTEAAFRAQGGA